MPEAEALLLVGHGSARYPDAAAAMLRHAAALRATGAAVEVAVLAGAPSLAEALERIGDGTVLVVPFFMEDGYFNREAVPRAVAAAGRTAEATQRVFCPPVGVHDGVAGIIERMALAACAGMATPSRRVAVVVIGHGSRTAPGRGLALHRHAARVAATGLFARIETACLEEAPFTAPVLAGLRHHPVVAIGFFAGAGSHVVVDVPRLLSAERDARGAGGLAVTFAGSVGDAAEMADIIRDQAAHLAPRDDLG